MSAHPLLGLSLLEEGAVLNFVAANNLFNVLAAVASGNKVVNMTTTTPPGSPSEGDAYVIPAGSSPTGAWSGQAGKVAYYYGGGWLFVAPKSGTRVFDTATKVVWTYSEVESLWFPAQPYRSTTEYWTGRYQSDGTKIYGKLVNCGTLPNTATKTVAHSITGLLLSKPIIAEPIFTTNGVAIANFYLPQNDGTVIIGLTVDGTYINITTNTALSTWSCEVLLFYSRS